MADVSFATGYFGRPAERFFPDRKLFEDLWIAPYFTDHGCCNFVAEDGEHVVGYIIGSCDTAAYRRYMASLSVRLIGSWLRGRYPDFGPSMRYLLRAARYPSPTASTDHFPAHLHVNVLARARGHGLGKRLLEAFLECLVERGVHGVHLSTTVENEVALGLYRAFGFAVWERQRSRLWRPWLGRTTTQVVLVKRLEPGSDRP